MNKVAVLIPHYNNSEGLVRSLKSIDSSENIDVFVIDDGSRDAPNEAEAKAAFQANGELYFHYLEKNKGIEHALNIGLEKIRENTQYKYIGRLDCGDICLKDRFAIQKKFLDNHPDVKLVGTNVKCVDTEGRFLYPLKFPSESSEIAKKMYLNSMFSHPGSMYTADVIDEVGFYPTEYKSAEDYAFFFKIVRRFKTANIDDFLLEYEINPGSISLSRRKQQVKSRLKIILDNFYFGFWPIYGLIRNVILYIIPNSILQAIKRLRK